MVGECTVMGNKGIQSHITHNLYDSDTWSIAFDHTIRQSGFTAEVSHYDVLGEQYFIRSLHTISVMLHYSSKIQSPSPPKLTLQACTFRDYVFNVTDSLLFLSSTKEVEGIFQIT